MTCGRLGTFLIALVAALSVVAVGTAFTVSPPLVGAALAFGGGGGDDDDGGDDDGGTEDDGGNYEDDDSASANDPPPGFSPKLTLVPWLAGDWSRDGSGEERTRSLVGKIKSIGLLRPHRGSPGQRLVSLTTPKWDDRFAIRWHIAPILFFNTGPRPPSAPSSSTPSSLPPPSSAPVSESSNGSGVIIYGRTPRLLRQPVSSPQTPRSPFDIERLNLATENSKLAAKEKEDELRNELARNVAFEISLVVGERMARDFVTRQRQELEQTTKTAEQIGPHLGNAALASTLAASMGLAPAAPAAVAFGVAAEVSAGVALGGNLALGAWTAFDAVRAGKSPGAAFAAANEKHGQRAMAAAVQLAMGAIGRGLFSGSGPLAAYPTAGAKNYMARANLARLQTMKRWGYGASMQILTGRGLLVVHDVAEEAAKRFGAWALTTKEAEGVAR